MKGPGVTPPNRVPFPARHRPYARQSSAAEPHRRRRVEQVVDPIHVSRVRPCSAISPSCNFPPPCTLLTPTDDGGGPMALFGWGSSKRQAKPELDTAVGDTFDPAALFHGLEQIVPKYLDGVDKH